MIIRIDPLVLVFCFLLFACDSDQPRIVAASLDLSSFEPPSRRELSRQIRDQGEVIIAYSSKSERLRAIAARFQDGRGRIRFRALPDGEITREMMKEKVIFALGSPMTNWISAELNTHIPFRIHAQGINFKGKIYGDSTSLLSVPVYPNPLNQKLPVVWASGFSDEMIARQLEKNLNQGWSPLGWNSGGYEIFQQGERILLGFFEENTWNPDSSLQFDFSTPGDTVFESGHFRFLANNVSLSEKELMHLSTACEQSAADIRAFTGMDAPISPIHLYLYPSAEEKGLRLQNTDQAHIDIASGSVHRVHDEIYRNNPLGKENELLLQQLLGRPRIVALERGLAVYFTDKWQIRGCDYWVKLLYRSGNMAALSEILDNEHFQNGSDYVLEALAASFVKFLVDHWGKNAFLEKYSSWQPSPAEIEMLEKHWHQALEQKARDFTREEWAREELPYLRGFNFAHEGYAIYNGYISRKAVESLSKMVELGSNAVSVIPYSFMRDPSIPAPIPISDRPGSENDESVINVLYAAKKQGMITVLKPQIWLGGGSWPGDIMMKNETDWQAFFHYYYEWIRHYALMAEIHQVDMLVIGTEFAKATLARQDDWTALIRKIRKLYSGKITYAANWGEEFEGVGFWKELDYIGLDCYYPLSKKENAGEKELHAHFKNVLKQIETVQKKYNKPLFFTEIGFRSIPAPWLQPHAHAEGAAYNGEDQKLCYEVVMKNLYDKEWCLGLMFWKWPSYLESRGTENTDYFPYGKPAEATVAEWFSKLGR